MTERIFQINFEPDPQEVLRRIGERCHEAGRPAYICVADGNVVSTVYHDGEYRSVVDGAMFSIVDSSWIPVLVRRLTGGRWVQYCGSDIFRDITACGKYRQYFLGSSADVLEALKTNLTAVDPGIAGMSFAELPFCDVDEFDYEGIARRINADSPDIVWLSLGAPKQERFAARLTPLLDRGVVIPVGAVFNFRAGLGIRRAPQWMVNCRLEWLWRIFSEPGKQIRRCRRIADTFPKVYRSERLSRSKMEK